MADVTDLRAPLAEITVYDDGLVEAETADGEDPTEGMLWAILHLASALGEDDENAEQIRELAAESLGISLLDEDFLNPLRLVEDDG